MTMNLNGIPIFPLSVADASKPLRAVQMPRGVDTIVYFTQPDTVATFPVVELDNSRIVSAGAATEDGFREYTVEVSVLAVDGKPVTLEGLSMAVIEAPGLGLAFGDIKAVSKGQDCGGNVKCLLNKMLERVRTIKPTKWAPKWAGGCHGKKGGKQGGVASAHEDKHPHHRPHGSMPHHRPYGDEDMPVSHHRHPHHRPHHGRPDHRQPSIFNRIVAQVLLPILVGIAAGMLVSIVGLVIGHVFVILYRRVKGIKGERCGSRKERRERRRRERLAKAEANGEVEKGLLAAADDEELPAYKDEGLEVVVEKE